ncbi:MAG TPA: glycosyltransferase [Burkholderiaceae bacterium]
MKSAESAVSTARRRRLAFVSPQFLFPLDAGGKIRTTNILRGLKGGAFEIVLLSVATPEQTDRWRDEIDGVCDEFIAWPAAAPRPRWRRLPDLFGALPVNVAADRSPAGRAAVQALAERSDIDLMVFDFVHSAVLMPAHLAKKSLCFTHNVEAEIFARHAKTASNAVLRRIWAGQARKMQDFERQALRRFDTVIAVSERDARQFAEQHGLSSARAIPTGVDLDFFSWALPAKPSAELPPTVVFTGSMDWAANIDGVRFFLNEVWPLVTTRMPEARFKVIGKSPPPALVQLGAAGRNVSFTGFVDDVRPHAHGAQAFVIPLQVGGGTRIKAFEAMAMGCPVVSTSIGIEGLAAEPDEHYLRRDEPAAMAEAILALLRDGALRDGLSQRARALVEGRFGHRMVAEVFQRICLETLENSGVNGTRGVSA